MNENKEKREVKVSLPLLIAIIAIIIVGAVFGLSMFFNGNNQQIAQNPNNEIINNENSGNNENANNNNNEIISDVAGNEDESGNAAGEKNNTNQNNANKKGISDFDLSFLKLENQKENKIYSPLSIKYALNMLE